MHQTHFYASWRISRLTTIEPEPLPDIVPDGRGPRRDFSAIHVTDRAANALILGLVVELNR